MPLRLFTGMVAAALLLPAENWPGFRGPTRQGISAETGLPTRWSAAENIAWKTPIPGLGYSSPIVWGDRVFVTTATEAGVSCRLLSLDRRSGRILWDREVLRQQTKRKQVRNSYATPTPVTDGELVYTVFSGGMAALDFQSGERRWLNNEVDHFSEHGLGASPILHQDLLIMSYDGSSPGDSPKVGWKIPWDQAVILALDKRTGQTRWRGKRGLSRIAHVTPNVLPGASPPQLVSAAGDVIQGFDVRTGERLWSVYAQGEGVVPSVVVGDGLVYAASGVEASTIRAVKPDGRGDVTTTHVAWKQTKGVPRIPSFLYRKPCLFTITEAGIAMCLRAETGEIVWQQRVGGEHSASPVWSDGLIYFLSDQGETTIIRAAPEYKEVARNSIGQPCQASIAISQGNLFLRSNTHLFCVGNTP